jgi:hypothetical protein
VAGTIAPVARHQYFDDDGNPLAGGLLLAFEAGTSTPIEIFTDIDLLVPHAIPAVLDAAGRITFYLDAISYKLELQKSDASVVWTQDMVPSTSIRTDAGRARALGGLPETGVIDTTYVDLPGVVIVAIDEDQTVQMHAMVFVSGGTGSIRLFNVTDAVAVALSELTFTELTPTLVETPNLSLSGAKQYKAQVKISVATQFAVAYGVSVVTV